MTWDSSEFVIWCASTVVWALHALLFGDVLSIVVMAISACMATHSATRDSN